jgi:hypothetical protein
LKTIIAVGGAAGRFTVDGSSESLETFREALNALMEPNNPNRKELVHQALKVISNYMQNQENVIVNWAERTLEDIVISFMDLIDSVQGSEDKFNGSESESVFTHFLALNNRIRWSALKINTPLIIWPKEPSSVSLSQQTLSSVNTM